MDPNTVKRTISRHSTATSVLWDSQPLEDQAEAEKPKRSLTGFLKKVWTALDLDWTAVKAMIKGGIAPTIAVAISQSDYLSAEFTTLGYLMPLISVLGFAIMPRAKFIQMMIFDVLAVCMAAAFALLSMYSSLRARENTDSNRGAGGSTGYNSSASAVSGVFLFFQIYLVNTVRAKFPQFQFPVIIYTMVANISAVYAPQIATLPAAFNFVKRIMTVSLIGLGLSTGTSLLVFPVTSRQVVFKEMAGYIGGLRTALKAHSVYFETLEHNDMFGRADTYDETVEKVTKKGKVWSQEAQAIRAEVQRITNLHGKLHGDLTFAKREFALGKLGPDDLQTIFRHLRTAMIPVVGLSFVVDVFQRLSDYNRWNDPIDALGKDLRSDAIRERAVREWNDIMRAVHDPFALMIQTIDEGLQHVSYTLGLTKPPKKSPAAASDGDFDETARNDVEAPAGTAPGEKGFCAHFEQKLAEFRVAKSIALRTWSEDKGVKLPEGFFDNPSSFSDDIFDTPGDINGLNRERSHRQLFLFLYMEQLLYSAGQVVLEFVRFADERVESGKLSRTRLIIPGSKRLLKWMKNLLRVEDSHEDDHLGDMSGQNNVLQLGEAYRHRKDPEHLPPRTTFERIGNKIRVIPWFLRSRESAYGFRVACATMTVAVICFLHDTQSFFIKQRFVWAMVMINLSMSPTSGESIFSFVLRILGTVLAMVLSLLAWYIPGQQTPGIIVFLFIFVSCMFYVPIKHFRFRTIGMITIMTSTMIIAYELQVRKVGERVATSNGQEYYPIYLLAPYRLAITCGGIAVAFIWTVFPYPISEHSALRQSLGASLYLLANYYSIIHETLSGRLRGDEGDLALKTSSGRRLQKARNKVFSKQMLMLNGLRTYSGFLKWEVPIGGRFPKRQYDAIILCIENIGNYLSLLGYASDTLFLLGDDPDHSDSAWIHDFRRLFVSAKVTTHEITSVLCLLSASITNRQPLPPYLKTPRPYSFSKRLQELDKDILSLRHIAEPGFAAFSVLQISTRCIIGDVERLMRDVKSLVGELDFSFHAVSTADGSKSAKSSMHDLQFSRAADRDKLD